MAVKAVLSQLNHPVTLTPTKILLALSTLFFVSGCAALIYQIMWQRLLFMLFGVDLLSVTIIVSVFMFGLGVGGLFGGYLADFMPKKLLTLYMLMEVGIALFGWVSPTLIDFVGNAFFSSDKWVVISLSFAVLAVPTVLMGATFPILVTHANQFYQNIGNAVGRLYFANTLGGAVGAIYAGFVLLSVMNIDGVIYCAAVLNFLVAVVAFILFRAHDS